MASNGRINVKEAVRIAVEYVRDLYAPDELLDLRMEEVELSGSAKYWFVTLGFSRPEVRKRPSQLCATGSAMIEMLRPQVVEREYKVATINAKSGEVQSMKIRQV